MNKFQGGEQDLIFLSMARCNREGNIGFCNDPQRLNVGITRAKAQCVVVGNSKHCHESDDNGLLWQLVELCDRKRLIIQNAPGYPKVRLSQLPSTGWDGRKKRKTKDAFQNAKCIDPHVEKAAADALRLAIAESKSRI